MRLTLRSNNEIVIPTEGYTDFLARRSEQQPHVVRQRHQGPQEIRASAVEGPAVYLLYNQR